MILLDSSVLSQAYRRRRGERPEHPVVDRLRQKIRDNVALGVPGIVVQELLSGVRDEAPFRQLQEYLEAFPLVLADQEDHSVGARLFNVCRSRGITATLVDCLIAAQAITRSAQLWSLDSDFERIARYSGLKLFRT
jgi:hypothetical protein